MSNSDKRILKKITNLLREKDNFLLSSHINPDGDAVGSLIALGDILKSIGKKVTLSLPDEVPHTYRFLRNSDKIVLQDELEGRFDIIVVLDTSTKDRTGNLDRFIDQAELLINIDHHVSNSNYADINYIDANAAAVGVIVYEIKNILGVEIDLDTATALFVAIMTDTGGFRYENSTSSCFRTVAELVDYGIYIPSVSNLVYFATPARKIKLLGETLQTLEINEQNRVAWIIINNSMLERTGARMEDSEDLINYIREIDSVDVSILFLDNSDGNIKVSFRSKTNFDVNKFANRFGGGGHPRASGCVIEGSLQEVINKVTSELYRALEKHKDKEAVIY